MTSTPDTSAPMTAEEIDEARNGFLEFGIYGPSTDRILALATDHARLVVENTDLTRQLAEAVRERDRALRNRDMWKVQSERQAEQLTTAHKELERLREALDHHRGGWEFPGALHGNPRP